jgi:predicted permease
MQTLIQDLRYSLRQLRKTPGFTLVCVLTLALGVGANTAIFSVMNAVLLRALPVRDANRLVHLNTTGWPDGASQTGNSDTSFSYPVFDELRKLRPPFAAVMADVPLAIGKVSVHNGQEPEEATGLMVSGNYFTGLGVDIIRGHGFTDEDESKHSQIAVLSYNYWTRRFSRDPSVVGQTLVVKGIPFAITGVTAAGFIGADGNMDTDFWVPLQNRPDMNSWGSVDKNGKTLYSLPDWWNLRMSARLSPGVSAAQATAMAQPVFRTAQYIGIGKPNSKEKPGLLYLTPARGMVGYDGFRTPLYALMAMVGLVLVIACCNVGMLLVARNATRVREFSLRLAIGAGRGRLFQQLVTESLLLVLAGGALAWIFTIFATRALAVWSHLETSLAPDASVMLFTMGVLVLCAFVFGLAPLGSAMSAGPALVLKTSTATSNSDRAKARTGRIVVALQMALCLVLLVGAGLLLRTLRNLQTLPLGLKEDGLLVFGINPQGMHSDAQTLAFYDELTSRLRVLPGLQSVTMMQNRIASGWSNNNNVRVDGAVPPNDRGVRSNNVGPDFFHTLGVPMIAGRDFTDADRANSPKVAIINQTFALRYMPGLTPLGHRIGVGGWSEAAIVGVVKDSKYTGVNEDEMPMAWIPYSQDKGIGQMSFDVRVAGPPLALLPAVQNVVRSLDPNLPLQEPKTQAAMFDETISQPKLFARLAGFFGLLAVVLVATGLYGTLAYRVSRRTLEIGVRMAVGAQRGQVVWMVVRDSLMLTVAGIVAGLPLAAITSRSLSSTLFGVKPYDLLTYVVAILGVTAVALTASLVPARRAASVDPISALRTE